MRKGLLILFFALFSSFSAFSVDKPADSLLLKPITDLPKWFNNSLNQRKDQYTIDPSFNNEMIEGLFNELSTDLYMELNNDVLKFITIFLTEKRENLEIALALYNKYKKVINEEVRERNMPSEIGLLPILLSGMNAAYTSESGGRGYWNLNYYTALNNGLKISDFTDERSNIKKSTKAALSELSRLYNKYNSWNLAITAFSSSTMAINKSIIKSGNLTNYWEVRPYLDQKEQMFIPAFFASVYVFNYYPEHDFVTPEIKEQELVRYEVSERILIDVLAKNCSLSSEDLYIANPGIRGRYVPATSDSIEFYIPVRAREKAVDLAGELISQTKKEDIPKTYAYKSKSISYGHPENSKLLIHTVKSGDVVGLICEQYKIRASSLRQWNNLRGDRIYIGQKLKIYVDNQKAISLPKTDEVDIIASIDEDDLLSYEVQFGDTLWDIVQMHPGNTIEGVQQINKITNELQPGQIIKLIKDE